MNIFHDFEKRLSATVKDLKKAGILDKALDVKGLTVEPPRDPSHGDISTNAAMVLAKPARKNPAELAKIIAERLSGTPDVEKVTVAGPGFINVTLTRSYWPQVVRAILKQGAKFGRGTIGRGQPVNVEFVSANPTGPMHVGHCRGAVFGDALANLLEFAGYKVTREYYINDAGAQVDVLARSAFLRYREALGEDIGDIPEGLYPGDYLKPLGETLKAEFGKKLLRMKEATWLPEVRERAIAAMMDMIRDDLAALNIRFDVFFSERSLTSTNINHVADTIAELEAKSLIYQGRLPPPKGKPPEDWEDREQMLFRATDFGDDIDRPLMKSDGSYTYFAADMAYHRDKLQRGFKSMIDVWGADHGGYVKRMQSAVKALSGGEGDLDVKICQLVKLMRAGEPVKMSKRSGSFVTLREVVEEAGVGPVRFMMIYRKNDAPLEFDFAKVMEQSRDNPVFYVQYAHARSHSVFREAAERLPGVDFGAKALAEAPLDSLTDDGEIALMRRLSHYPRIVEQAASAHEPHRIAFYLYELASDLHGQWNRGKELPHLRFIVDSDRKATVARVALVGATSRIIASGLKLLGVNPVTEMR